MLFDGYSEADHNYEIIFKGEELPSGMYYFRIQAGDMVGGGKMVKID